MIWFKKNHMASFFWNDFNKFQYCERVLRVKKNVCGPIFYGNALDENAPTQPQTSLDLTSSAQI